MARPLRHGAPRLHFSSRRPLASPLSPALRPDLTRPPAARTLAPRPGCLACDQAPRHRDAQRHAADRVSSSEKPRAERTDHLSTQPSRSKLWGIGPSAGKNLRGIGQTEPVSVMSLHPSSAASPKWSVRSACGWIGRCFLLGEAARGAHGPPFDPTKPKQASGYRTQRE